MGQLKVYINGDEELLTLADSTIFGQALIANNDSPLIIGNSIDYNKGLLGVIDELRIWNVARLGEDIRSTMEEYLTGNESGLAAYWKMDEGNGNEILDLSGNENTGMISAGKYSDGIDFSVFTSSEDYIATTGTMPLEYHIAQNYPNPFNPATTIEFQLPVRSHVQLDVYDVSGELVKNIISREYGAGSNRVVWTGKNNDGVTVTSGVYFYRIIADNFTAIRKMLLLR